MYFCDLYMAERLRQRAQTAAALLLAAALTCALVALAVLMQPSLNLGRRFYGAALIITTIGLITWRTAVWSTFSRRSPTRVLVVGGDARAHLVLAELERHAHLGYSVKALMPGVDRVGWLTAGATAVSTSPLSLVDRLDVAIADPLVRTIVFTESAHERIPVSDLLRWRMQGIEIVEFESFYERITGRLPLAQLRESWLVLAPGVARSASRERLKRLIDLAAAVVIAILASPIALLAAVAIKLDSPGPVFYRQRRVGRNGREFVICKFRSMRDGAERATGAVWAQARDPRVTRVGRIIRALRIDELPQLFNVIKGDMSMVGPRPERPEIVARLIAAIPLYQYRHSVKPGLTGWAQVCYPYGATIEDAQNKLCYDLYYIKNPSLLFDLQIILQTVKIVLFGRGAR